MAVRLDPDTIARAYYRVDPNGNALPGNTVGAATLAHNQVSVNTAATLIVAARSGRGAVTITNITGAQQVYIGNSNVSAANGALLPASVGASLTLPFSGAVYGIALTAAQTVSYAETY